MIQRIQTLFLLGVFLLNGSHFFFTMAYNTGEKIRYSGFTPFVVLILITSLISLITIFLYRRRMAQIRLTVFNSVIIAAYQIWILFLFFTRPEGSVFSVTALFPLISLMFSILAIKYIGRDEAMIRSANSLRKRRKK